MAGTTRKRAGRRLERMRRSVQKTQTRRRPEWPGRSEVPPPGPEDLDGGAGVREPRRPLPTQPAGALELPEPEPAYLDLVR